MEDTFKWSISHQPRLSEQKPEKGSIFVTRPLFWVLVVLFGGTHLVELSQIQGSRVNLVQGFYQSDWLRFLGRRCMQDVNKYMFDLFFKKEVKVLKWNQAKRVFKLLCRSSHMSMCNNDVY